MFEIRGVSASLMPSSNFSLKLVVWSHINLHLHRWSPPHYLLNTGGLYDNGIGLNKGLQTVWIYQHFCTKLTFWYIALLNRLYLFKFTEQTFSEPESQSEIDYKSSKNVSVLANNIYPYYRYVEIHLVDNPCIYRQVCREVWFHKYMGPALKG